MSYLLSVEIERLEAELKRVLDAALLKSVKVIPCPNCARLEAENAALKTKVEMYHWLRDGFGYLVTNPALRLVVILEESADAYESVAGEKLDRIIREAMKEQR